MDQANYERFYAQSVDAGQIALVYFLVLVKSNYFAGFSPSTVSYSICKYRALMDIPPSSSYLLKVHSISSEVLFNATAVIK